MRLLVGGVASRSVDFRRVRSAVISCVDDARDFIERYNGAVLGDEIYVRILGQRELVFSLLLKFVEENQFLRLCFVVTEDSVPGTFLSRMVQVVKDEGDVKPSHILSKVVIPRGSRDRVFDIFGIRDYENGCGEEIEEYAGI